MFIQVFIPIYSVLMYIISEWCLNITILNLSSTMGVSFKDFYWISDITDFQNLEKLEIDIIIHNHVYRWKDDYESYLDMLYTFFEFPMYKLKELKLRHVNAFCQDEFLGYLSDAFPNLETLVIEVELNGKLPHWRFHNLINVLHNLGSVKNLFLPNMDLHLATWNDTGEHDQSLRETEYVFRDALHIIQRKFPLSIGELKITERKYGFVILKEKMKKAKLFNIKQANRRPVSEINHDRDSRLITLKLKPKRKKSRQILLYNNSDPMCSKYLDNSYNYDKDDVMILSEELVTSLYKNFTKLDSIYDYENAQVNGKQVIEVGYKPSDIFGTIYLDLESEKHPRRKLGFRKDEEATLSIQLVKYLYKRFIYSIHF